MRAEVSAGESLALLRDLVAAEGGELAAALVRPTGGEPFGPLVAASERCQERSGDYALLVECIFEGYLLHYHRGRVLEPHDDDLCLLAGDYLYAQGLARLAALGDLEAVRELADVIALSAQAHARPSPPSADATAAIWIVGVLGVAGGPWRSGDEAKQGLREGRPEAASQALATASDRAAELGTGLEGQRSLIAFRELVSRDSSST